MKYLKVIFVLSLLLFITACGCEHKWGEATCLSPKTCSLCGKEEGKIIEHNFREATCALPKTCNLCGFTEGEPNGHNFIDATCTTAQKCNNCAKVQGTKLGHNYVDYVCTRCGDTNKLSESCDMVLISATDNGDIYEIVANESEDYNGVVVEVGVIKNNKWVVKPTTDMPFVDDDKTLYGDKITDLNSAPDSIYYIGNGCFLYRNINEWGWSGKTYEEIVYNVNNQKYYELIEVGKHSGNYPTVITYEDKTIESKGEFISYGEKVVQSNSELVIWQCMNYDRSGVVITLLNTNTMETQTIELGKCGLDPVCHPLSEGLFAITTFHGKFRFYDTKGNMVIDLSSYDLTHEEQPLFFKDGKCTFTIFNNNDKIYKITVDKKGKVIESIEQ